MDGRKLLQSVVQSFSKDNSQLTFFNFFLLPTGVDSKVHHMTSVYTNLDVLDNHLVLVVPLVQLNLYINRCYQVVLGALENL